VSFDPKDIGNFFDNLGRGAATVTSLVPASVAQGVTQAAVGRVTFRTALSPAVEIGIPSFDSKGEPVVTGDGQGSMLNPLAWLKPEIRIEGGMLGTKVIAPYGVPDDAWQLRIVALGAGIVGLGALWWGAKALAWKAALVGGGLYVASRMKS
jgi:hypothetical protein